MAFIGPLPTTGPWSAVGLSRGQFFDAPGAEELQQVYETLGSRLGADEEQREVTVAFAGAGLILMLAGGALAAVWFNRFP